VRKLQKILVAALVLSMVLGLVGTGFAAAPTVVTKAFSDTADKDCEEAMAMLGGLGIYKGDRGIGGPARPEDPITRAEVAAVITRVLGRENTAKAMQNYAPPFVDSAQIPSWAWGYVSVASSLGIVKGYPDGSFKAGNNVTHAEMLAMLVRALGHDSLVKGIWPTNYIVYGHSLGLTDGVEVFANLPATRGEVAIMAANALEADVYDEVADKELKGKSLLTGKLRSGFEVVDGTVTDVDVDGAEITIDGTWNNEDETDVRTEDLASQVVLVGISSLGNLEDLRVKAMLAGGKVVYIEVIGDADVVSGILEDEADITADEITLDGDDDYTLTDDTKFYINGTQVSKTSTKECWEVFESALFDTEGNPEYSGDINISLTLGENDKGKEVVKTVKATVFDIFDDVITDVEKSTKKSKDPIGWLDFESGKADIKINANTSILLDGEAADFDDLDEDMVVYVARAFGSTYVPSSDAYKVEAYSDSITGDVESVRTIATSTSSYRRVTLVLSDKSKKTVRLSGKLTDEIKENATITLVLNADGYGRFISSSKGGEEVVFVTGLAVVEEGEDVYSLEALTFERSGEEDTVEIADETKWAVAATATSYAVTYGTEPAFSAGDFVEIKLNTKGELTGVAVATKVDPTADWVWSVYRVYASDSDVSICEYKEGWATSKTLVGNPLVYKEKDEKLSYIGVSGLSQYDKVDLYKIGGTIKAIVRTGTVDR
jgi:hypothetical protein